MFGCRRKREMEGEPTCRTLRGASAPAKKTEDGERRSGVVVLGGGCAKCHELEANANAALSALGCGEKAELVTDVSVIAAYGVLSTPALVIDGKVACCGRVLKREEIIRAIRAARA